jgi:A/G-specific adenine glycosylase
MTIDIPQLRRDLLRWYAAHKRDLPWRRTRDPYAILVSELMLQQTQVKTALPYYERFLALFPTAADLAVASEEQVLAAWAGLGYYRRARFLHAAARAIVAAAAFPESPEGIRALPGVGAYTAAAVGSIAFGLPDAVVDGNVVRVVARLLALDADPTKGEGAVQVRQAAQDLLDTRHPGDFNQAVMELGASLCSPTKPQCPLCPLRKHCAAFLAGRPEDYPRLPARAATRLLVKTVLLVVQGSGTRTKVLARVRKEGKNPKPGQAGDRLRGFWAFPELELEGTDWAVAESAARKEGRRLGGPGVTLAGRLPKVRHRITVYDIHLLPLRFQAGVDGKTGPKREGWEWLGLGKLSSLPLASAEKKLLALLEKTLRPGAEEGAQLGLKI